MINLFDNQPEVNVQETEYARLLGYPREWVLEGRARELAEWARDWYAAQGRPWVYLRPAVDVQLDDEAVVIEGEPFFGRRLATTLRQADAHNVVVAAVSAGPELEAEAQRLWHDERPDEYFFLEVYGSAVVEHLVTMAGARLCAWAEDNGQAVLPHTSPGYAEWDVAEQPRLLEVIKQGPRDGLPGRLNVLDSGMLQPKKSLLAVFGLTRRVEHARGLAELVPCQRCSFANCQYRRAAYVRPPAYSPHEAAAARTGGVEESAPAIEPLDLDANYAVNVKALERWSRDRLSLRHNVNGTIDARFRYEGSTCTNMGRALAFDYTVRLGLRDAGYRIQDQQCAPAAGHDGYVHMCSYMDDAERLMRAIDQEKPLLGQPLDDVLNWPWSTAAAGCYCDAASRTHKWGLVLETIHYALARYERERCGANGNGVHAP